MRQISSLTPPSLYSADGDGEQMGGPTPGIILDDEAVIYLFFKSKQSSRFSVKGGWEVTLWEVCSETVSQKTRAWSRNWIASWEQFFMKSFPSRQKE